MRAAALGSAAGRGAAATPGWSAPPPTRPPRVPTCGIPLQAATPRRAPPRALGGEGPLRARRRWIQLLRMTSGLSSLCRGRDRGRPKIRERERQSVSAISPASAT
eukprot:3388836-Pyramimonas_sp.AAC.1